MAELLSDAQGISHIALHSSIRDDDGVDQLHHFVTVTILTLFAAIMGYTEYSGEPINCWNYGSYLFGHYAEHVNKFCWTHSLYKYPNTTNLSVMPYELDLFVSVDSVSESSDKTEGKISFNRWVTVIFLLQAFLFKLPNLLWTELNAHSGSNIYKMVEILQGLLFSNSPEKSQSLQQVGLFLEQWLRIHRKPLWFMSHDVASEYVQKTLSCCMTCIGTDTSNHLSTSYLVVKALFLLNNILQFGILSIFLQTNFWEYGKTAVGRYSGAEQNRFSSNLFPIVVLCHFQTYEDQTLKQKWVQCVLTVNLLLEKLLVVEWLWLSLLLAVTFVNFFTWCFKILQTQGALKFVQSHMRIMDFYSVKVPVPQTCSLEEFVTEYLRSDGIFILRIFAVNTNDVVVSQLVEELWKRYLKLKVTETVQVEVGVTQSSTVQNEDIQTTVRNEDNVKEFEGNDSQASV